jgi:hypothetical protein
MISIVFFFCVCVLEEFSVRFMSKLNRNAFHSLLSGWPETGPRKFLELLYYQARVLFFLSYLSKLHNQPTNIHERYLLREVTKNTNKLFEIKIPKFG